MSMTISDKVRYAICASLDMNKKELKSIRKKCIPILSEPAFLYRYVNDSPYEDIYRMAYEVGFDEISVCQWFEKYGFGDTKIEFWKDDKWKDIDDFNS